MSKQTCLIGLIMPKSYAKTSRDEGVSKTFLIYAAQGSAAKAKEQREAGRKKLKFNGRFLKSGQQNLSLSIIATYRCRLLCSGSDIVIRISRFLCDEFAFWILTKTA